MFEDLNPPKPIKRPSDSPDWNGVGGVRPEELSPGQASSIPEEDFDAMMERAFPGHLRGSISGCCDSMDDGHGAS